MQKLYNDAIIFKNKRELINKIFSKNDNVLDVGFCGQGIDKNNPAWNHNLIKKNVKSVFGIDIDKNILELPKDTYNYELESAEQFNYNHKFSKIYAGDLIEHLSNPGSFLDSSKLSISHDGQIIITTPNTFNLFNMLEKLFKLEPTINREHCSYYNLRTLQTLLTRHGLKIESIGFIYSLETKYEQSIFKKIQNILYFILSLFTKKFLETIVIFAKTDKPNNKID